MNVNLKKSLMTSAALGLAAFLFSSVYIHFKVKSVTGGGSLKEVVVAASDIGPHTMMEPGLAAVKKVPKVFIQPGAAMDLRDILGRVSVAPIKKGEQILTTKLVSAGGDSGLSPKIANGRRAVGIAVREESGVAGLIRPDDRVDVIVTFDYGDGEGSDKYTYTLFQDVEVLAVDSDIYSIRNPDGVVVVEKKSREMFASLPVSGTSRGDEIVVTLALMPDDVQKFIFAREAGIVTLSLRSPSDRAFFEGLTPVKVETLTGKMGFLKKGYREYRGR